MENPSFVAKRDLQKEVSRIECLRIETRTRNWQAKNGFRYKKHKKIKKAKIISFIKELILDHFFVKFLFVLK